MEIPVDSGVGPDQAFCGGGVLGEEGAALFLGEFVDRHVEISVSYGVHYDAVSLQALGCVDLSQKYQIIR